MLPGDRLVCALVNPLPTGSRFTAWPLHLTIVPWFRAALGTPEITAGLQLASAGRHQFPVTMDGEAHFGRRGRKPVSLVALPNQITRIEQIVRGFLKSHAAWIVDESTKAAQPYRPHVTAQGAEQLHSGDTFLCRELYIIEQLGAAKTVAAVVELAP